MKIGFLTACLPRVSLGELVPWAAAQGFEALELAAWPSTLSRSHQACHLDAERFTPDDAQRIRDLFEAQGMTISSLAYYGNNLHPDLDERSQANEHLRRVIDAAALLGGGLVGTFVGAHPAEPAVNVREGGALFRDVVAYAEDRGVRVMIENCPMLNWVQFGLPGNYAYSPELWDALFNEVPSPSLGLNFDPSHLYWLGIDYDRAARHYAGRIFHVHAKDAEILPDGRYRHGILGEQLGDDPWHSGWWRYRMPGRGGIDWDAFVATLRETGYEGALSIEHEDPDYDGSDDAVKEGLRLGLAHLQASRRSAYEVH